MHPLVSPRKGVERTEVMSMPVVHAVVHGVQACRRSTGCGHLGRREYRITGAVRAVLSAHLGSQVNRRYGFRHVPQALPQSRALGYPESVRRHMGLHERALQVATPVHVCH